MYWTNKIFVRKDREQDEEYWRDIVVNTLTSEENGEVFLKRQETYFRMWRELHAHSVSMAHVLALARTWGTKMDTSEKKHIFLKIREGDLGMGNAALRTESA